MHNITVMGRIPSKKNSKRIITRGGKPSIISSESYEAWQSNALWDVHKQWTDAVLTTVNEVEITFFWPDKRRCDLSNKAESIMDLLVDAKINADDNWGVVPRLVLISGGVDKVSPRADIVIK